MSHRAAVACSSAVWFHGQPPEPLHPSCLPSYSESGKRPWSLKPGLRARRGRLALHWFFPGPRSEGPLALVLSRQEPGLDAAPLHGALSTRPQTLSWPVLDSERSWLTRATCDAQLPDVSLSLSLLFMAARLLSAPVATSCMAPKLWRHLLSRTDSSEDFIDGKAVRYLPRRDLGCQHCTIEKKQMKRKFGRRATFEHSRT